MSSNTYVSQAILQRIKEAGFFLCLEQIATQLMLKADTCTHCVQCGVTIRRYQPLDCHPAGAMPSLQAQFALMTRDKQKTDGTYTTSPWLLEEKGAALALGKPIVLMIEEGVDDFGGLQGDWQRIHFGPKGFLKAAIDAVDQLKSYAGGKS